MRPFEIYEVGRVAEATTLEEWQKIDGVLPGYAQAGFEVTSLEKENFFGELLLTASSSHQQARVLGSDGRSVPGARHFWGWGLVAVCS